MAENNIPTANLLVIDDEIAVVGVLVAYLQEEGHNLTISLKGKEALQLIADNKYDVILTDLILPDLKEEGKVGGLEILMYAKEVQPSTEVIVITGHSTLHSIKQAIRLGAYDLIVKPFTGAEVVQTVANAHNLT